MRAPRLDIYRVPVSPGPSCPFPFGVCVTAASAEAAQAQVIAMTRGQVVGRPRLVNAA